MLSQSRSPFHSLVLLVAPSLRYACLVLRAGRESVAVVSPADRRSVVPAAMGSAAVARENEASQAFRAVVCPAPDRDASAFQGANTAAQ
jgi:hypothetical protein